MAVEVVPTVANSVGTGPLSGQTGMIALALTAFLLIWQIILLAVAARTLHVINNDYRLIYPFLLG